MSRRIVINSLALLTIMLAGANLSIAKSIGSGVLPLSTCSGGGNSCHCAKGAYCVASKSGCSCVN